VERRLGCTREEGVGVVKDELVMDWNGTCSNNGT